MSVINTNIKSLVAQDSLVQVNRRLSTAMERLSTGSRINSAKDDAAGLAISTRMEAQSRGLTMAIKNANDGISLMQTSEGAMDEVTNILQRMRELAVQSVNGTNNAADRSALDAEVQQLKEEIDRIATTTEFNSQKILDGSFKDKVLQIGDKAYQTMEISIDSVKTSDLGMGRSSLGGDALVSTRVTLGTAVTAGNIMINGQALGAIASGDDLGDVIDNINASVDNVTASGFNEVVAKAVGTGVISNSQLDIEVTPFGATGATVFNITAADSLEELVDNINAEAGGLVQASLNDDGKLVLSNNTGATITVKDTTLSGTGFTVGNNLSFKGFLKLEADDDSSIRIERGNLGKASPGTLSDIALLGFREITKEPTDETYTVMGTDLTSAGVNTAWGKTDLSINGVEIYDQDIDTSSFAGKLNAINNFTDVTGVFASAKFEKSFTIPVGGFTGTVGGTDGKHVMINGTIVRVGEDVTEFASNINSSTREHGLTATVNGDNLILSGENVQKTTVGHVSAAYNNTLVSSVNATAAAAGSRILTIRTADIVAGRTLELSIVTTAGSGNVSVTYTIQTGDTVTSVAFGIKNALLRTQTNYSGADLMAVTTAPKYLGTQTGTTIVANATAGIDLTLSGSAAGAAEIAAADISLRIVDGPSKDIGTYRTRIGSAGTGMALQRDITFSAADLLTGGVYELRIVSGEFTGPTGSSTVVRVTYDGNGVNSIATAFAAALTSPVGAFAGQVNTFNHNGLTALAVGTDGAGTLQISAGAGYGRAMIHFYKVDEVLGAATTHFGALKLDSTDNSPISIALGDASNVDEHGFLELNVGAADYQVNSPSLGVAFGSSLSGLNVLSASSASKAISSVDNAIEAVSQSRSQLGAYQNRLINTVNNLDNIVTNTEASRSRIQDTDYALETTALAKAQIIQQAATAMLAQANQQPQSVLALLQ